MVIPLSDRLSLDPDYVLSVRKRPVPKMDTINGKRVWFTHVAELYGKAANEVDLTEKEYLNLYQFMEEERDRRSDPYRHLERVVREGVFAVISQVMKLRHGGSLVEDDDELETVGPPADGKHN